MLHIIKKEINMSKELLSKIEWTCKMKKVKPEIINDCLRIVEHTNLAYVEPHRVIIKDKLYLFFNEQDYFYIDSLENKYGIQYTRVGDYYLPNLVLEKEKIVLNKYGRMRLNFLKENRKAEYTIMFVNGTLNKHLKEIQETAQDRIDIIIEQLKQQNNLTEEIKNTD